MSCNKTSFLHFPAEEFCTTIMSIGPPFSGKTWLLINCLKYWLENGMFEKYFLVIPQFKNEMEGSYNFLNDKKYKDYVVIYESFHEDKAQQFINEQTKNRDLFRSGKIKEQPRYFFAIDDATSQGAKMFRSAVLKRLATENRHLFIHSWFLLHYDKGVLDPKVRQNLLWLALYPLKKTLLKHAYENYVDNDDFDEFDEFKSFFDSYVKKHEHGFLLIRTKGKYNPGACNWFNEKKTK